MLLFQYQRLQASKLATMVCVATTLNDKDNVIEELCLQNNIHVFRGSEEDVLHRYTAAATYYKADVIVRINSDCPLIDPIEIDNIISNWIKSNSKFDYMSNILQETFPMGMHIEVFSRKTLYKANREATLPEDREHVTPYIYKNPLKFNLCSIVNSEDLSYLRWTVDYPEDLKFINKIVDILYFVKKKGTMGEIVELLKNNPNLLSINNMYVKKQSLL